MVATSETVPKIRQIHQYIQSEIKQFIGKVIRLCIFLFLYSKFALIKKSTQALETIFFKKKTIPGEKISNNLGKYFQIKYFLLLKETQRKIQLLRVGGFLQNI